MPKSKVKFGPVAPAAKGHGGHSSHSSSSHSHCGTTPTPTDPGGVVSGSGGNY